MKCRGVEMTNKFTGFDVNGFMEYLARTFNGFENTFLRGTIENIINYGLKQKKMSNEQFCYWVSDLLPEVSFGEVAVFLDKNSLCDQHPCTDTRSVAVEVVEIFETLLQNHGIDIPNEDRKQGEDSYSIYGMDYAQLLDDVCEVLEFHMKG